MRFNGKELAALALQPSHKFDKEGVLVIHEKQDGLFRRGDVSIERWCRLRGNMLFYFKSRDQYSEPAGVIILEQYTIQLDSACDDGSYSFTIVFDNGGGTLQFSAVSECERDAWIQALHMASYEYMRSQLQALHTKLNEKIKKATAIEGASDNRVNVKNRLEIKDEPYLEMSLACDNLMCDGDGQPPNPVVYVYLKASTQTQWSNYAQTEVIQRSSNPCFLTTVNLIIPDSHQLETKIKLVVYDVRERLTNTMTFLGSAIIPNENILSEKLNFRLPLLSGDLTSVGFISVAAWQVTPEIAQDNYNSDSGSVKSMSQMVHDEHNEVRQSPLFKKASLKSHASHCNNLGNLFDNIISQTYRFHTGLGAVLSVHEIMAESRLCFVIPQKIVQLFIKEEKDLLHALTSLGNLKEEWSKRQSDLLERHLHVINTYTISLHHMDSYEESNFKPSSAKNCKNLEFVPVNLHLQRIWVHNDSVKKCGTYDVTTVGAFAAHSRRFRHGGLLRLLNQLKLHNESKSDKLAIISEVVAKIKRLKTSLEDKMEELRSYASNKNGNDMYSTMTEISKKSQQLIGVCDSTLIDEACSIIEEFRITQIIPDAVSKNQNLDVGFKSPVRQIAQLKERSRSLDGSYLSACKSNEYDFEKLSLNTRVYLETNIKVINNKNVDSIRPSASPNSLRKRANRMTRHGSLKDDKRNKSDVLLSLSDKRLDVFPYYKSEKVSVRNGNSSSESYDLSTSDLVMYNNVKNEGDNSCIGLECTKDVSNNLSRTWEEPEPWDLTQLNIEASVMCMASKVKSLCRCSSVDPKETPCVNWVDELVPSIRKLNQALDCLLRTAHFAQVGYLMLEPIQLATFKRTIQHRRDVVFVQALTSVIVSVMTKLWSYKVDAFFLTYVRKVGLLAQFEGLLSCHGDEMGMLEDMIVAVDDINAVNFKIVKFQDGKLPPMPKVEGSRLAMSVSIPCPDTVFNLLNIEIAEEFTFHITTVFFNVGINEQATIAERESCSSSCMHSVPASARKSIACMYAAAPNPTRFGDVSLQDRINSDGLEKLKGYYNKYIQVPVTASKGKSSSSHVISELLDRLSVHVHSKKCKNVEILHLASKICRLLDGLRFTSCKSAKDRTSMSVTLEQCTILREHFDLAEPEFCRALECMRCEGTRRENALKNAGVKKYAFNSLQLMALPRLYRPPAGTYGNVQT